MNVLITGASRGIGRATALLFWKHGHKVIATARDAAALASLSQETNDEVLGLPAQLTEPTEIEALIEAAEAATGGLDVLVSNAGVARHALVHQMSLETWFEVLNTNLTASFLLSRALVAKMLPRQQGKLIFVSSISATRPFGGFSAYSASKAGLLGLTRSLAEELRPHGIQSMAICPGSVDTEMLRQANPDLKADMSPEEVAEAIYFLATSPRAMTGSVLDIFG